MQSYFHQDWNEDFATATDVATHIVQSNSADYTSRLIAAIQEVLKATTSDSEVASVLEQISCDYVPVHARQWLSDFLAALKAGAP